MRKYILCVTVLLLVLHVQAQKGCKPIITTDAETNEVYTVWGVTFNSGGLLGALVGNSNTSKEQMTVMGGFLADKTIVVFQLDRIVGANYNNKTNLKDLMLKKGEKIIVKTGSENIPFYTVDEVHSSYKNKQTGLGSGTEEKVTLGAVCYATKTQLQKLASLDIDKVIFVITNANVTEVSPTKNENKKFHEQMNCLLETDKFKNSPETPIVALTEDEAIAALKKAKDKLDLGLITKEEFDKVKQEMIKYIKH